MMRKSLLVFGAAAGMLVAIMSPVAASQASAHPKIFVHSNEPPIAVHNDGTSTQGIAIKANGNWSGYVDGGTAFKYVAADYSVPSVNCTKTPDTFSYHWVGLGGATTSDVEQDGVAAECNGSTPVYFAWYEETYDEPSPIDIESVPVGPGDAITSSVAYVKGTFTYKLTDISTGESFSIPLSPGQHDVSSAEVITEGYITSDSKGTSAFGAERYDTATVTDAAGVKGGVVNSHWATAQYIANEYCTGIGTPHVSCGNPITPVAVQPGPISTNAGSAISAFKDTWEAEYPGA